MRAVTALAVVALVAFALPANAQAGDTPPPNGKKLSEIIATVEKRPDFSYIKDVEWGEKGYEVTYFTKDNAKVEIKYDPVTATPMNLQ